MKEKATVIVNSEVLDNAPSHAFTVTVVDENTNGDKVLKPVNQGRILDRIKSIALDEDKPKLDFLFEDGSEETYDAELLDWWSDKQVLYVFGRSDDLVEFRGCLAEEHSIHDNCRFKFNGTEFEVEYSLDGEWVFDVTDAGDNLFTIESVGSSMSEVFCEYSEVLRIESESTDSTLSKLD